MNYSIRSTNRLIKKEGYDESWNDTFFDIRIHLQKQQVGLEWIHPCRGVLLHTIWLLLLEIYFLEY
jgi:hypothetical protein